MLRLDLNPASEEAEARCVSASEDESPEDDESSRASFDCSCSVGSSSVDSRSTLSELCDLLRWRRGVRAVSARRSSSGEEREKRARRD